MATAASEASQSRTYPVVPESTWWKLRKQFRDKPPNRVVVDEEYVINVLGYASTASARNLIRPLKRIGLIGDDDKPTELAWKWIHDEDYREVCQEILHANYPPTLTEVFGDPNADLARVETWFARNARVASKVARQYAAFYMLLVRADPAEQDAALSPKSPKAPKTVAPKPKPARARPNGTQAQAASAGAEEIRVPDAQNGHDSEHRHTSHTRQSHGFEPTLNINVQIHIPSEASPDQIEQIFKSMAKHLYKRQGEASE